MFLPPSLCTRRRSPLKASQTLPLITQLEGQLLVWIKALDKSIIKNCRNTKTYELVFTKNSTKIRLLLDCASNNALKNQEVSNYDVSSSSNRHNNSTKATFIFLEILIQSIAFFMFETWLASRWVVFSFFWFNLDLRVLAGVLFTPEADLPIGRWGGVFERPSGNFFFLCMVEEEETWQLQV